MDDFGNRHYSSDNWIQYLGCTMNPYGFYDVHDQPYFNLIEGM